MDTDQLLAARGTTHGAFAHNAVCAQQLRAIFRASSQWGSMRPDHKEALDMIATKISRILSGQADFAGHWEDLAGYAELARKACGP